MIASSCGGSDETPEADLAAESAPETTTDTPPEADLAFLGSLASPDPETSSATFDATGGSFTIGGATVTVPPGALSESTVIGSIVVELDFTRTVTPPLEGTVYSLATADDVALGEPVVLEIAKPSDSVIVKQRVDGEWTAVAVPPGPTTRVNIDHFSEVTTTVMDRPAPGTSVVVPLAGDEVVPAAYLASCLLMFTDREDHEVVAEIGYSVCTQSLIDTLTPFGAPKIPAACVGDKIGPAVDIRVAIAQCVDESTADTGESTTTVAGTTDQDGTAGESEDGGQESDAGGDDDIDSVPYVISRSVDQQALFGREVASGQLEVSVVDGVLTASGTVTTEDPFVWPATGGGPTCTAFDTYVVEARPMSAEERELVAQIQEAGGRLVEPASELYTLVPSEVESVFEGPDCDDEVYTNSHVEFTQTFIDQGAVVFLSVTNDEGTLRGSVDYDGTSNNLQRAG